jgi:hypothetical protein
MPYIMHDNIDEEPVFKVVRTKAEADGMLGLGFGCAVKVNGIKVGEYTSREMSKILMKKYADNQRETEKLSDNNSQINNALAYLLQDKIDNHKLQIK